MGMARPLRLRPTFAKRRLSNDRFRIARIEALERRIALGFTWAGGGDGVSCTDPANWSVGRVPGTSDDVVLDVKGDLTVICRGSPASVLSLVNHETIWVQGSTATGPANLRTVTDLSNIGTQRLETISDDVNDRGAYLTIGGILTNQATGRVEANAGAGDARLITGTASNHGLVTSSGIEMPIVEVYIADGGTLGGNAIPLDDEVRVVTVPATPKTVPSRLRRLADDRQPAGHELWVEGTNPKRRSEPSHRSERRHPWHHPAGNDQQRHLRSWLFSRPGHVVRQCRGRRDRRPGRG